jgi:DNA-binding PadR family transcriptional regulator
LFVGSLSVSDISVSDILADAHYINGAEYMSTKDSVDRSALTPVSLQILLALADGKRHGYGIKLEIEARTQGAMNLGSGTLYEAIQRLESVGYITEAAAPPNEPTAGRKRRYYRLEAAGKRALEVELGRMERIVRLAKRKKLVPRAG